MLLLDNSAWSRLNSERLDEERRTEIIEMTRGLISTCLPFLLEAGDSAQSAADRQAMMSAFDRLPHVPRWTSKANGWCRPGASERRQGAADA